MVERTSAWLSPCRGILVRCDKLAARYPATVKLACGLTGKWFACFSCEVEPETLEPCDEEVGIDVGIKVFAVLSNEEFVANPRFFRRDEKALAKTLRKFDKVKHKHRTNSEAGCRKSQARRKAKEVVARVHERITTRRHDFVHQTARRFVNRFGGIAVEDLTRPCESRAVPPERGQREGWPQQVCRRCSPRSVPTRGFLVVAVPAAYTSQTCSGRGDIVEKALDVRVHRRPACDLVLARDTNAGINLLAAVGQRSLVALAT